MKRVLILALLILLVSAALFAQVKAGSNAWVSSKTATLKSSTGFFASTRGTLEMGAQVEVLKISGNYAEIKSAANADLSGWTALSNLSARQIVSSGSGASASEVALAGKGFNQEVEGAYRAEGVLNYADVDLTETITVSQEELYAFITEGRLNTGE